MLDSQAKAAIAEILQTDPVLLNMLPPNKNWYDQDDSDEQPRWSIVPLEKFNTSNPLPQVTIQAGGDTRLGTHLIEAIFYIRCYNSSDKSFVEITSVLARVKELLDGVNITLPDSSTIEVVYQTTQAELEDQAYGLPFRESRYSWQRV